MRLEERRIALAQIGAGNDPQPVELLRSARPDAVETPDLQAGDEVKLWIEKIGELTTKLS